MVESLRVLLVEDSADTRDLYVLAMGLEGYEVRGVRTAGECLSTVAHFRPDVLVCDLRLPDAHGHGLIRSLRAEGYFMPAIALTGTSGHDGRMASLAAGYSEHYVKPVGPDELISIVGRVARANA